VVRSSRTCLDDDRAGRPRERHAAGKPPASGSSHVVGQLSPRSAAWSANDRQVKHERLRATRRSPRLRWWLRFARWISLQLRTRIKLLGLGHVLRALLENALDDLGGDKDPAPAELGRRKPASFGESFNVTLCTAQERCDLLGVQNRGKLRVGNARAQHCRQRVLVG